MSCAQMLAALATPGLTPVQRLIYATIVGFSDGCVCRTSLRAIADHLQRPDRSGVLKVIKELSAQRLIEITRNHDANEYRLMDPAVWSSPPHRSGRENHTPVVVSTTPVVVTTTPGDPGGVVPTTTPNGGNQPILELVPRARVDSDSSIKKEREEDRKESQTPAESLLIVENARVNTRRRKLKPGLQDWTISEAGIAFAEAKGVPWQREVEKFRAHHESRNKGIKDFDAAWRTWCLNYEEWRRPQNGPSPTQAKNQFPTRLPPRDQDPMMGMVRL